MHNEYPWVIPTIILLGAYLYIARSMKKARRVGENPISFIDWIKGKHLK